MGVWGLERVGERECVCERERMRERERERERADKEQKVCPTSINVCSSQFKRSNRLFLLLLQILGRDFL